MSSYGVMKWDKFLMLLALLLGAAAAIGADDELFLQLGADAARVEERFEFVGSSHYEFGLHMGERFAVKIRQRFDENTKLQELLLTFARTEDGKKLYWQYVDSHSRTFPVRRTFFLSQWFSQQIANLG